jgi:hypothetical protein
MMGVGHFEPASFVLCPLRFSPVGVKKLIQFQNATGRVWHRGKRATTIILALILKAFVRENWNDRHSWVIVHLTHRYRLITIVTA